MPKQEKNVLVIRRPEKTQVKQQERPLPKPVEVMPFPAQKRRKKLLTAGNLLLLVAPVALWLTYVWMFAVDRYETGFSFSVRAQNEQSPQGSAMAAMMGAGGGTSSDAGVVSDFITSREMVSRVMSSGIDLHAMFSREVKNDPLFSLGINKGSLEDVSKYWKRAVSAERDPQTGIVRVSVTAFSPNDAKAISEAVLNESMMLVQTLSEESKADLMRSSEEEVARAQAERDNARSNLSAFRVENSIVDPVTSLAGRTQAIDELRMELDKAMIAKADVMANSVQSDVRIAQADVRIKNLQDMIDQRLAEFGDERGYAVMATEFEDLQAKAEFSEMTLRNAMTVRDAAKKEADMRSSYLVPHVLPHQAETSTVPNRMSLSLIGFGFIAGLWLLSLLIKAAIREKF